MQQPYEFNAWPRYSLDISSYPGHPGVSFLSPQHLFSKMTKMYLKPRTHSCLCPFPEIPEIANAPSGWRQQRALLWPWTAHLMLIWERIVPCLTEHWPCQTALYTCLQDPGIQDGSRQSHWNLITSFPTTSHLDSVTFLFCLSASTRQLKGWCRILLQRSKRWSCSGLSVHFLCAFHGKK